jgi:hypothetical protein
MKFLRVQIRRFKISELGWVSRDTHALGILGDSPHTEFQNLIPRFYTETIQPLRHNSPAIRNISQSWLSESEFTSRLHSIALLENGNGFEIDFWEGQNYFDELGLTG